MTVNTQFMKYITFILFIFLTTIVCATNKGVLPYIARDNVNMQIFSRFVLNQQEIKKSPQYMRVLVAEELISALDNKYLAYKMSGKHLSKMSKKQRKEFVNTIRYYLIKIYNFLLKQQKNK